jgi:hypothetical protein
MAELDVDVDAAAAAKAADLLGWSAMVNLLEMVRL